MILIVGLNNELIPWDMHLFRFANNTFLLQLSLLSSLQCYHFNLLLYEIVIVFSNPCLTFWCTGSKRKQSYLQHDKNWRGALCCWFSCTIIHFTSILHLCCHFAWNFCLQQCKSREKPTVISVQFTENASWGGCWFLFQISHNWEGDWLQESERNSSILCAEPAFFSYCTRIKYRPDQPCCSD